MLSAPGITVNDTFIPSEQIGAEVQYHPASSLPEARYQAMEALVVRALLVQRARTLGLCEGVPESEDSSLAIERLLELDIEVAEPLPEECVRYFNNNVQKFRTAPFFEVSHILYPASPSDRLAREDAHGRAGRALVLLRQDPSCFEALARQESACPSAMAGGFLGQIGKGQTLPAFEAALFGMQEGEVSGEPVETEVGFHIIYVHQREEGQPWPRDRALEWVATHLKKKAWMAAFHRYVRTLAGSARISGFRFREGETPLMQ